MQALLKLYIITKILIMLLFVIILQLSVINCNLNITETTDKIKYILNNYKTYRYRRCTGLSSSKVENFVKNTLNFFDKTHSFGEYLKYYNISQCSDGDNGENYLTEHIINGLLINEDVPESHWQEYKTVHKKTYPTHSQEMAALAQWRHNLRRVARHNRNYLAGKQSYSIHLNLFGDMGGTDYFNKVLKLMDTVPLFHSAENHHKTSYRNNLHKKVPTQVDWRAKGFRPRREEQWQCGACYAFAVTHAVQAQLFRRHGDWRELSPQQIVDCSHRDGNSGCDGGSLRAAMRYAARDGLVMERNYPYRGKKGRCLYTKLLPRIRPRRWGTLPLGDEDAIERALATTGPLAVAVNAAPFTFQLYRSGIYDDLFCTPWQLNHALLLVGYTPKYWVLLNWWGKNWGEDGYIRIRRGFNRCGVANMATYVEL